MSNDKGFDASSDVLPCIFSVEGLALSDAEKSLFSSSKPLGFILFKRNCENKEQLKSLVGSLKDVVGRDCPVLIDQEGGRVARLCPPVWYDHKPMSFFEQVYKTRGMEAAHYSLRSSTLRLANELKEMGINVNCAPVLDLLFDGAHDIIGDRSFGSDPQIVALMGKCVCDVLLDSGITPVIKHIPGHGRAKSDSHLELPFVKASYNELRGNDFIPFKELAFSSVGNDIWAMSAHITFEAFEDDLPVTLSKTAVSKVIRDEIGFDGVLIGDDLDMKALDEYGSISERAVKSLEAGCDLALYCSGDIGKMEDLAGNLPAISDITLKRLKRS